MKNFLFLFLLLSMSAPAQTVVAVHDGDSYRVKSLITESVRIEGVDCPEIIWPGHITESQPLGVAVGDSVRALIKGKKVVMETFGQDQYGRTLARISIEGRDLAEVLLSRGWGWYIENDLDKKTRRKYQRLRDAAKKKQMGVWSDPGAVSPKTWRKTHRPLLVASK